LLELACMILFTQDWTLICAWLTMIFAIVYFLFGDFVTDNFEANSKTIDPEMDADSVRFEFMKRPTCDLWPVL